MAPATENSGPIMLNKHTFSLSPYYSNMIGIILTPLCHLLQHVSIDWFTIRLGYQGHLNVGICSILLKKMII